jgi:hypothetical protein
MSVEWRIGTWNLDGRWTPRHADLMARLSADVWLLTEVVDSVELDGMELWRSPDLMLVGKHWSAVAVPAAAGRCIEPPHPATAAVELDGVTCWSSVLPWRGSGRWWQYGGDRHAERTQTALRALVSRRPEGPLVWGGDWNHALTGPEQAGSAAGRRAVLDAVADLALDVTTEGLPHQSAGGSIDHIAVPRDWRAEPATRQSALVADGQLSDHDAYTVDVFR